MAALPIEVAETAGFEVAEASSFDVAESGPGFEVAGGEDTGWSMSDLAMGISNELVKSYGFRIDDDDGTAVWSLENIKDAFVEDPFWTTVDYLTLLFTPVKMGMASLKVAKGANAISKLKKLRGEGAVGKELTKAADAVDKLQKTPGFWAMEALSEGKFAGKKAQATYGKLMPNWRTAGHSKTEVKAAREALAQSPGSYRQGGVRLFGELRPGSGMSPSNRAMFDEAIQKAGDIKGDIANFSYTGDLKTAEKILKREKDMVGLIGERMVGEVGKVGLLGNFGRKTLAATQPEAAADVRKALEAGGDILKADGVSTLGVKHQRNAVAMQNYMTSTHTYSLEAGSIDSDTFVRQLTDQGKKIYEDMTLGGPLKDPADFRELTSKLDKVGGVKYLPHVSKKHTPAGLKGTQASKVRSGTGHLKTRKGLIKEEDMVNDMGAIASELDNTNVMNSWLMYARKINTSMGTTTAKEMSTKVGITVKEATKILQKEWTPMAEVFKGVGLKSKKSVFAVTEAAEGKGYSLMRKLDGGKLEEVGRETFSTRLKAEAAGNKLLATDVPPALQKEVAGRFLDPAIAKDILASNKAMKQFPQWYRKVMHMFKQSKVTLNPATHGRNTMGNHFFQGLASGLGNFFNLRIPARGLKALVHGGDDLKVAIRAGVDPGTLFDEQKRLLALNFDEPIENLTEEAIEKGLAKRAYSGFVENAPVGKLKQWGEKAGTLYGVEDRMYRLGNFIHLRKRYLKQGLSDDDAIAKASYDIHQYFPQFTPMGVMADTIKQHVPFASFTMEALRVSSNGLTNKPHVILAYTHMFEVGSMFMGTMAGVSPKEIADAQRALPPYMDGKKTFMWPLKDKEGNLQFIDFSYIMPLSELGSEMLDDDKSMTGIPRQLDPFARVASNPFISTFVAAFTGKDSFTQRELEPSVLGDKLGLAPKDSPGGRKLVGMAEYMLKTILPPLMPPGYAGVNLIEAATGRKSSWTGEEMEANALRTVLSNVGGVKIYSPSPQGAMSQIFKSEGEYQDRLKVARDDYKDAIANDEVELMRAAKGRIEAIVDAQKGLGAGRRYFEKEKEKWIPGSMKSSAFSEKRLTKTIDVSRKAGVPEEQLGAYLRRRAEIQSNKRGRK